MKKTIQRGAVTLLFIVIASFFGYNYLIYGGERDIATETVDYFITAKRITSEFTSDVQLSNKKYLEKAVAISGQITTINDKEIILNNTIICNLQNSDPSLKKNIVVTIKGRIVGYDDLLEELKLDQCLIIKKEIK
ncbi:OB-fold protein [Flavobacterium taihuense]|uniref:tRNA_anti-like n=1 Tax=Flavobacterium taihuense TaxID=2857508 RepID=A0ABS6XXH2_9FLAO|nr:hypothetical protein [Flavobacterium taihuense]MBW4360589.1 hypothetical protein [Flavobacterium taihuense]